MSLWQVIGRNLLFFPPAQPWDHSGGRHVFPRIDGCFDGRGFSQCHLQSLAEQRIGKGDIAMLSPDGFFEEDLATRIHDGLKDEQAVVAPIALFRGMMTSPDGSIQVANVQVLGATKDFGSLLRNSLILPWVNGR